MHRFVGRCIALCAQMRMKCKYISTECHYSNSIPHEKSCLCWVSRKPIAWMCKHQLLNGIGSVMTQLGLLETLTWGYKKRQE